MKERRNLIGGEQLKRKAEQLVYIYFKKKSKTTCKTADYKKQGKVKEREAESREEKQNAPKP